METTKKIKMSLAFVNKTESELARDLGTSRQSLNQRMKTDKFTTDELSRIAESLGAKFVPCAFEFPDGTKI
ncbi:MAG: helix-turn-helix domain containing protein [Oscillospiraceae bacterium]|nr:helix-turn-helix domain containing protein [Oscillospiraceae bacterium]